MLKILVFSDIHGSVEAVNTIVDITKLHKPTHILLLGDILYHGPRNPLPPSYNPAECARVLSELSEKIIAVQGNCDSDVDKMLLGFPVAYPFSWLLVDQLRVFATHGHVYSPTNLPKLAVGDVFLYGHTHIPTATIQKGIYLCNPGSLTLPKEDHPKTYGLLDSSSFSVITETQEVYLRLECL